MRISDLEDAIRRGHATRVNSFLTSNLETCITEPDAHGYTLLHLATQYGHSDVVDILLSHGADVSLATPRGHRPLHIAASCGNVSVINVLLCAGACTDPLTNSDATPLYLAAANGSTDVVAVLLAAGANPNLSTDLCPPPLHIAAFHGHAAVVVALLDSGANVATVTNEGTTALHIAAACGHRDVVAALIAIGGAAVDTMTWQGVTAAQCARAHGHHAVQQDLASRRWSAVDAPQVRAWIGSGVWGGVVGDMSDGVLADGVRNEHASGGRAAQRDCDSGCVASCPTDWESDGEGGRDVSCRTSEGTGVAPYDDDDDADDEYSVEDRGAAAACDVDGVVVRGESVEGATTPPCSLPAPSTAGPAPLPPHQPTLTGGNVSASPPGIAYDAAPYTAMDPHADPLSECEHDRTREDAVDAVCDRRAARGGGAADEVGAGGAARRSAMCSVDCAEWRHNLVGSNGSSAGDGISRMGSGVVLPRVADGLAIAAMAAGCDPADGSGADGVDDVAAMVARARGAALGSPLGSMDPCARGGTVASAHASMDALPPMQMIIGSATSSMDTLGELRAVPASAERALVGDRIPRPAPPAPPHVEAHVALAPPPVPHRATAANSHAAGGSGAIGTMGTSPSAIVLHTDALIGSPLADSVGTPPLPPVGVWGAVGVSDCSPQRSLCAARLASVAAGAWAVDGWCVEGAAARLAGGAPATAGCPGCGVSAPGASRGVPCSASTACMADNALQAAQAGVDSRVGSVCTLAVDTYTLLGACAGGARVSPTPCAKETAWLPPPACPPLALRTALPVPVPALRASVADTPPQ